MMARPISQSCKNDGGMSNGAPAGYVKSIIPGQSTMSDPAQIKLKRLELKLKQFAEVETFLMKECEQVERTRQRIAAERARMITA
ncbi:hypothetical protein SO802_023377 [Lithocarpus litseifolius]|uniref:SMARCC C-terminal domain-containing protein n=1 Tax=Lithocarpus litseifolius TaxID=425828 RepID=A0AAW2C988_9ROSI